MLFHRDQQISFIYIFVLLKFILCLFHWFYGTAWVYLLVEIAIKSVISRPDRMLKNDHMYVNGHAVSQIQTKSRYIADFV